MFKLGALTVAVMVLDPGPLGVVKPLGVDITRFAVPAVKGWKPTVAVLVSALMVIGLFRMVPTVGAELVTVTLTVEPVRIFWLA